MPTSITLNLNDLEVEVLEQLAKDKGMTKTAVLRQALRTYQMIEKRLQEGSKIYFENDKRLRAELVLL